MLSGIKDVLSKRVIYEKLSEPDFHSLFQYQYHRYEVAEKSAERSL